MSDKPADRRTLLKSIAVGSAAVVAGKTLPESWSKPVVNAVMLPAHAETSPEPVAYYSTNGDITGVDLPALAVSLCTNVVEGSASITGNIGPVVVSAPSFALPGSAAVPTATTDAIITMSAPTGSPPNREIDTTIEYPGYGIHKFVSSEAPSC